MSLRTVSLLLLVVSGVANEAADTPAAAVPAPAAAPAKTTNETSWSNFVYCKCGLTCVKQMGSWYIFDLGQSCACQACAEETADATGHLRGSQEPLPKDAPKEENQETEPKAQKPEAATHTEDTQETEGTETKLSLKSLNSAPVAPSENEDKWEGANVRGSNMLYCKCGKKCEYGRQLGLFTYYCFRYGCNAC